MALELGVAEAVRFELTKDSRPCRFSRPVHSTALPRFRDIIIHYFMKLHQAKITKPISFLFIILLYIEPIFSVTWCVSNTRRL